MDGTIRSVRAARPARNDAGAVQLFVWDAGAAMNRLAALFALFAVLTLGSCNKTDNSYQGWIEANLILVGPDEVGRVQTLSAREGDVVKSGRPLFTVDDDLQQADLAQVSVAGQRAANFRPCSAAGKDRVRNPEGPRCRYHGAA